MGRTRACTSLRTGSTRVEIQGENTTRLLSMSFDARLKKKHPGRELPPPPKTCVCASSTTPTMSPHLQIIVSYYIMQICHQKFQMLYELKCLHYAEIKMKYRISYICGACDVQRDCNACAKPGPHFKTLVQLHDPTSPSILDTQTNPNLPTTTTTITNNTSSCI